MRLQGRAKALYEASQQKRNNKARSSRYREDELNAESGLQQMENPNAQYMPPAQQVGTMPQSQMGGMQGYNPYAYPPQVQQYGDPTMAQPLAPQAPAPGAGVVDEAPVTNEEAKVVEAFRRAKRTKKMIEARKGIRRPVREEEETECEEGAGVVKKDPITIEEASVIRKFRTWKKKKVLEARRSRMLKRRKEEISEEEIDELENEFEKEDVKNSKGSGKMKAKEAAIRKLLKKIKEDIEEVMDDELTGESVLEPEQAEDLAGILADVEELAVELNVVPEEDFDDDMGSDDMGEELPLSERIKARIKAKKFQEFKKRLALRKKGMARRQEGENAGDNYDFPQDYQSDLFTGKVNGSKISDIGTEDIGSSMIEKAKLRAKIRRERIAKMRAKMNEEEIPGSEFESAQWPVDNSMDGVAEDAMLDAADEKANFPAGDTSLNEKTIPRHVKTAQRIMEKKKLNFSALIKSGNLG